MQQHVDPLIEAAVKPLAGNAEQRMAAIDLLMDCVEKDHPGGQEAIARWQKSDAKWHPFLWQGVLCIVALATGVAIVGAQLQELSVAWKYRDFWSSGVPDPFLPQGLTPSQRLLVGDPAKPIAEQKKALHLSDPTNPAFYALYAQAFLRESGKLPDGYFETVSGIAPENAYFYYLAAASIKAGTIQQKDFSFPVPEQRQGDGSKLFKQPEEQEFVIHDRPAFEISLTILEKAATLLEFDTYQHQMLVARLRALPKGGTFAERMNRMVLVYQDVRGMSSLFRATTVLSARAQQLSFDGDVEGFLALTKIREHLIRGALHSRGTLMDSVIAVGFAVSTAEYFHYAAQRLGLPEISGNYLGEFALLRAYSERLRDRGESVDDTWLSEYGSPQSPGLARVTRYADVPPSLSRTDLSPTRYADHALLMRIGFCAIAVFILPTGLLLFLFRFLFPPVLRNTAARLVQLLSPSDWIVIFVLGVIFPLLFILALQYLTPLGGREWASNHFLNLFPGVHLIAILLLILLTPAVFIRWRLSRRIAPLGIPCRPGKFSILALLGIIGLSITAYPIVLEFGTGTFVLKALAAAPAFWLVVVFWNAIRAIIRKATERISLAATSMALLPSYAVAVILISLLLPVFKASEEHWLSKDRLHNLDPELSDFGSYEFRLAAQKRKETREILGLEN